jgi:hypothetical protein
MRFLNFQVNGLLLIFLATVISTACKQPKTRVIKSPPHYDFSKVQTVKLGLGWRKR